MEEINFIRPQEVFNRDTGESKVRYTSYDGSNKFIPVVDGEDGVPRTLVVTTHAELKAMRDAGKLTPGSLYRITDYQCTTTQENTKSAGHQFDIVLLALSENKLAEEGWAMEHPTDVYDVTFLDGIIKKCYIYKINDTICNIIIVDTMLGFSDIPYGVGEELQINEENKTANCSAYYYTDLNEENLTYNYFQNSNLSAWKVWYCLDNDTARFAWADDSVDEGSPASIIDNVDNLSYIRNSARDEQNYFAWDHEGTNIYTETSTPSIGDTIYLYDHGIIDTSPETVASYTPPTQGTGLPNGRGVIYRLIDEWNNDVPYDFKNIQFKRIVNNYNTPDPQGQDEEYFYTFSLINDDDNHKILDASMFAKDFLNDENGEGKCHSNYISSIDEYTAGFSTINKFTLSNIILVGAVTQYDSTSFIVYNRFECCHNITLLGRNRSLTFSDSANIICEDFIDIYNIIVLKTWNQVISISWSNNIIHMEEQRLKKVSFVNL